MINQDLIKIGIANSDTHDRRFTRTSARTLIASDIEDASALSSGAESLAANVLAGKAVATNAPFLLLQADGEFKGSEQRASFRLEHETTLAADSGSDVLLTATVATPSWAEVDTLEFYINNQPKRITPENIAARYGVCPNIIVRAGDKGWIANEIIVNEAVQGASRTEITATVSLQDISEDTWVVVIARGSDGISEPLFPALPASLNEASNQTLNDLIDGNLGEGGIPAFAFTNPLFIDVNGDGWSAPGVANAACSSPP